MRETTINFGGKRVDQMEVIMMLQFTGQPRHQKIDVLIPYRAVQDENLVLALIDAIKILAAAIGSARGQDISAEPEATRWTKEFLVGFSLLAVGECRSMLLLLSDKLNRHARVHLRSLYEYELRAKALLADPKRSLAFRDSLAYEMRDVARRLNGSMDAINAEIAESLGLADASGLVGTKEKDAFGGNVRRQMKDEVAPEKRYMGTFAWASLVSHGSILALRELSRATKDTADDLLFRATDDNKGHTLLYSACWLILWFALKLRDLFGVSIVGAEDVVHKLMDVNKRLKVVSPEQEAAAMRAINEHAMRSKAG